MAAQRVSSTFYDSEFDDWSGRLSADYTDDFARLDKKQPPNCYYFQGSASVYSLSLDNLDLTLSEKYAYTSCDRDTGLRLDFSSQQTERRSWDKQS